MILKAGDEVRCNAAPAKLFDEYDYLIGVTGRISSINMHPDGFDAPVACVYFTDPVSNQEDHWWWFLADLGPVELLSPDWSLEDIHQAQAIFDELEP